jgi:hypothetical protein
LRRHKYFRTTLAHYIDPNSHGAVEAKRKALAMINSKRYQRIADSNSRSSIWCLLVPPVADLKTKHGCLKPCFKAGKGTRTLDIQLGKLIIIALFQLFKDALFVINSHGVGSSQSRYALHF